MVFLSIFTKCLALSPFKSLNSAHLSKSQMDVRPSVQKTLRTMAFYSISTGDSDIPSSCEMKDGLHLRHCRESQPSFESGHLGSIILEAENTESLSHTYFWGQAPLELLLESWLTSSGEDRESFSSPEDMQCTEVCSSCSNEIDDPLYLRQFSQGISRLS